MKVKQRHRKACLQAEKTGFFRAMARHVAVFNRRGSTLVVTFDNMKSRETPSPAFPWGADYVERLGHSHLGIMMSRRNDWFRHSDLFDFFEELQYTGFFTEFRRVIFYGASMGGYGALSFAAAAPGAQVVAFAPQTSLDPRVTPFETRYRSGFARGDWDDPRFADGAAGAALAGQVTIFADPYEPLDRAHVARLPSHNLRWMRCGCMGHNPARALKFMNVLGKTVGQAFDGSLTEAEFAATLRGKRDSKVYQRQVLTRAVENGHAKLALNVTSRGGFPNVHRQAEQQLAQDRPGLAA